LALQVSAARSRFGGFSVDPASTAFICRSALARDAMAVALDYGRMYRHRQQAGFNEAICVVLTIRDQPQSSSRLAGEGGGSVTVVSPDTTPSQASLLLQFFGVAGICGTLAIRRVFG
jgi:hypothetical protein